MPAAETDRRSDGSQSRLAESMRPINATRRRCYDNLAAHLRSRHQCLACLEKSLLGASASAGSLRALRRGWSESGRDGNVTEKGCSDVAQYVTSRYVNCDCMAGAL